MLTITQLQNKNILVLGVGVTGLACVRYLHQQSLTFAVNDSRQNPVEPTEFAQRYPNAQLFLGQWQGQLIHNADVIIVSPGIDLNAADIAPYLNKKTQIWGDIELFFQVLNEHKIVIPTLAVTGSNGKSTVVSLLAHIGEQLGQNIALAGNIGSPILDLLTDNQLVKLDCLVLELSSFQLETLASIKAVAATILNISDDHLDRHKTIEAYQAIKQRIYEQASTLVFNRDDRLTYPLMVKKTQQLISFGRVNANENTTLDIPQAEQQFALAKINNSLFLTHNNQPLISVNDLPLAGEHNALNCLAALALGKSVGWSLESMLTSLTSFSGLAHRCQKITTTDDISWINDSKATNVGATLAAIEGLASSKNNQQKLVLIAGGDGKGADFSPLKIAIANHIDLLITLGKDGDKIAQLSSNVISVKSLEQAVETAKNYVNKGDIVLLSPACASLDMFKNFAERGNVFMNAVKALVNENTTESTKESINE